MSIDVEDFRTMRGQCKYFCMAHLLPHLIGPQPASLTIFQSQESIVASRRRDREGVSRTIQSLDLLRTLRHNLPVMLLALLQLSSVVFPDPPLALLDFIFAFSCSS
jgi:hypothetical protein